MAMEIKSRIDQFQIPTASSLANTSQTDKVAGGERMTMASEGGKE